LAREFFWNHLGSVIPIYEVEVFFRCPMRARREILNFMNAPVSSRSENKAASAAYATLAKLVRPDHKGLLGEEIPTQSPLHASMGWGTDNWG